MADPVIYCRMERDCRQGPGFTGLNEGANEHFEG